jgi:hypothetical protein
VWWAGAWEVAGGCGAGGWCSHPRVGKHFSFDGRLLHGAPPELALGPAEGGVRVTLLVNLWLQACPAGPEPLPHWCPPPPQAGLPSTQHPPTGLAMVCPACSNGLMDKP